MITTKLITLADISAVKSISLNTNEVKQINPHILEAQNFDLRDLIGDEFYLDLIANIGDYTLLFNGGTYTHNGKGYYLDGIKQYLVYCTYARYTANSGIIATPTGMVAKTSQYSDQVSEKTIARIVEQARSGASFCENSIRLFLDRKRVDYPFWSNCEIINKKTKIRQI